MPADPDDQRRLPVLSDRSEQLHLFHLSAFGGWNVDVYLSGERVSRGEVDFARAGSNRERTGCDPDRKASAAGIEPCRQCELAGLRRLDEAEIDFEAPAQDTWLTVQLQHVGC